MIDRSKLTWLRRLCFAFVLLGLLCGAGCQSRDSIEKRLQTSIEFEHRRPKDTPAMKKASDQILAVLQSSTKSTLKTPAVGAAFMGLERNKYRMFLFWVEENPTIDAVELNFAGITATNAISKYSMDSNKMEAEGHVVFLAIFNWEKDSELWSELAKVKKDNPLKIRLLRGNEPRTSLYPVEYVIVNVKR
jgi:hypothetical protein